MKIVHATKQDLEFLINLRNEEVNAKFSKRGKLSPEEIEKDYFHNPKKIPFIAKEGEIKIGYIIFTKLDKRKFEISVALDPQQRGSGKGKILVEQSTTFCLNEFGAEEIIAEIYPENRASLKVFESAGYRPIDTNKVPRVYSFKNESPS